MDARFPALARRKGQGPGPLWDGPLAADDLKSLHLESLGAGGPNVGASFQLAQQRQVRNLPPPFGPLNSCTHWGKWPTRSASRDINSRSELTTFPLPCFDLA